VIRLSEAPAKFVVKKAYTHNVVLFPVLTEAALKQADAEADLTLSIAAYTTREVLNMPATGFSNTSQGLWTRASTTPLPRKLPSKSPGVPRD
jgi:hypothetical protein